MLYKIEVFSESSGWFIKLKNVVINIFIKNFKHLFTLNFIEKFCS